MPLSIWRIIIPMIAVIHNRLSYSAFSRPEVSNSYKMNRTHVELWFSIYFLLAVTVYPFQASLTFSIIQFCNLNVFWPGYCYHSKTLRYCFGQLQTFASCIRKILVYCLNIFPFLCTIQRCSLIFYCKFYISFHRSDRDVNQLIHIWKTGNRHVRLISSDAGWLVKFLAHKKLDMVIDIILDQKKWYLWCWIIMSLIFFYCLACLRLV